MNAPLTDATRKAPLPHGNVVIDAKRLTNYFRISHDGSMIFGGRGGVSHKESERIYRRLGREIRYIPLWPTAASIFAGLGAPPSHWTGLPGWEN